MPLSVETHRALALDQPQPTRANGRSNLDIMKSLDHAGDAPYHPCPEAYPAEGVPEGAISKHVDWDGSTLYPDTRRDLYVYQPAGFNPDLPARLMVFQDGYGYASRQGAIRATRVLDTLQATNEIEQTVGVFINPGIPAGVKWIPGERNDKAMAQRSYEYDSVTPVYGEFLLEEVLPFVGEAHNIRFTDNATQRTICGISSGGICAFTTAWMHPDRFQRVLSHCGSFTAIRGGAIFADTLRWLWRAE